MADQRYVVFFTRTGVARVFDSYNLAQANYPKMPIYTGASTVPANYAIGHYEMLFEWVDSRDKFRHGQTHVTLDSDKSVHPKPRTIEGQEPSVHQDAFWKLALAAGDHVKVLAAPGKRGKSPSSYVVDLPVANAVLASSPEKLPGQCLAIIRFFTEKEFDHYTKDEMYAETQSLKFIQAVKTQQDPWRIFRYYRPTLYRLGVLK